MSETSGQERPIILYTTRWCGQSLVVERFFGRENIAALIVDIDKDPAAREELVALNQGYASVPTVLFPDGSHLTEPTIGELREKLGLGHAGLVERIRTLARGHDE
jgi:mycoredoxin